MQATPPVLAAARLPVLGDVVARQWPAAPGAWLALATLVAMVALGCLVSGLRFPGLQPVGLLAAVGFVIAALLRHLMPGNRVSETLEFLSLLSLLAATLAVLSYLCAVPAAPLRDRAFDRIDHALGLDWVAYLDWVMARQWLAEFYARLYATLIPQFLVIAVVCGLTGRRERLHELFWGTLAGGVVCCIVSGVVPAAGPAVLHGAYETSYWQSVQDIRAGLRVFNTMRGIITFPSFHTFLAIIYMFATRNLGLLGWGFAALNAVMLAVIAPAGGHYFCDQIAGAAIALLIIAGLRRWRPGVAS